MQRVYMQRVYMQRVTGGQGAAVAARFAPRVICACSALLLAFVTLLVVAPRAAAANYPGYAQVQAAKAAVSDANATVAQLDAAVAQLSDALHEADVAVLVADDAYAAAEQDNERAQLQLFLANARADEADRALVAARSYLAGVARAQYRSGGQFGALEAVATSTGFEDVIARTEALKRAGDTAEIAIDRVRAAELVQQTLRDFAAQASEKAIVTESAAKDALQAAVDASAQAEQALAETQVAHDEAVARLAALRNTSAALEAQRQAGLAASRSVSASQKAVVRAVAAGPAPVGGYSAGTTDKGEAAVNFALAQLGKMYLYGAAGPDRWDCSGLTMVAWGNQGVYLPRSSKSQYSYVAKVTYPELRAGDLIFWGSGGNPGSVYHVAMYVGNNIVVEATKTGYPVKTRDYRNWAAGDRMAYVGRP
jgi:cell wall-associated NlpC family hydrolase